MLPRGAAYNPTIPASPPPHLCPPGGGREGRVREGKGEAGGGRGREEADAQAAARARGGKGGGRYSRHPYQSGRRADEKGGGPTGHPTYRRVPGWQGRRGRRVAHDTGATIAVGPQKALPCCARRHPSDHRRWRRQTSTVVGRWKRCGGGTGKEAAGVRRMEVAALSERGNRGGGRENRRGSGRRRCRRSCRSHSQRWKGRRAGRVEHATVAAHGRRSSPHAGPYRVTYGCTPQTTDGGVHADVNDRTGRRPRRGGGPAMGRRASGAQARYTRTQAAAGATVVVLRWRQRRVRWAHYAPWKSGEKGGGGETVTVPRAGAIGGGRPANVSRQEPRLRRGWIPPQLAVSGEQAS